MARKKRLRQQLHHKDLSSLSHEQLAEMLEARQFPFPPWAPKGTLARIVAEADLRQIKYQTLPVHTLLDFLRWRNIHYDGHKTIGKIAALLRRADHKRSFPRFLELPAEVRENVYEFAMQNPWLEANARSVQPAITRASRLVRREALYVFYTRLTFTVTITACSQPGSQASYASKWLQPLAPSYLHMIRHLKIEFLAEDGNVLGFFLHFERRTGAVVCNEHFVHGDKKLGLFELAFPDDDDEASKSKGGVKGGFRFKSKDQILERGVKAMLAKLSRRPMDWRNFNRFLSWAETYLVSNTLTESVAEFDLQIQSV